MRRALHYLKAVEALKDKDTAKVMAKMKEMPTDDPLFGKGKIRTGWPQDPRHVPVRGQEARASPRASGTSTSSSPRSRPTRPSVRSTKAAAPW